MLDCPCCGALVDPPSGDHRCPRCDSLLETTTASQTPEPEIAGETGTEAGASPPDQGDALVAAFRAQFERHELVLPADWVQRLHRLAVEFEPSRRHATVFFADLCGYSRLTAELTTRQHDDLLRWYYATCIRHVEQHGGFVIRFVGDAVYAAFGAPWSFERDAESAVHAVLGIRDDTKAHAPIGNHHLAIRAGVSSGPVDLRLIDMQGRPAPDLFGTTVNLAARLQSAAGEGQILVADSIEELLRGVFVFEAQEQILPKNFARPVTPYRLVRPLGADAIRRPSLTPFVGRLPERDQLQIAASAVRVGGFRAIRILGEAGIGKTRLVQEALTGSGTLPLLQAAGGPQAQFDPLGVAFQLLCQAGEAMSDGNKGEDTDARDKRDTAEQQASRAAFERLARLPGLDPAVIPGLAYLFRVAPQFDRVRTLPDRELRRLVLRTFTETMAACGSARPCAVFADDFQWSDPLSAEAIGQLAARRPAGVLLLIAARAGDPGPGGEWEEVRLGPLTETEREELLRYFLDPVTSEPRLLERVRAQAEGIPLYLVELAQLESQKIGPGLPAGVREVFPGVPTRLIEVLQARVDGLSVRRRALLQCGAVLGQRFTTRFLRLFREFEEDMMAELAALKGLRLLRESGIAENDPFFSFAPLLLRDVAYEGLTPDQRSALHRVVAEGIEKRYAERRRDFALELAHHWTQAGDLARASPHLFQAVLKAVAMGCCEEAWGLLEPRVQEPPPEGDPLKDRQFAVLLSHAGRVRRMLGDRNGSDDFLRRYQAHAAKAGLPRLLAHALYEQAWNAHHRGNDAQAEQLLAEMPDDQPEDLRRDVANLQGMIAQARGLRSEARAIFQRLLDQFPPDAPPSTHLLDGTNNLGIEEMALGNVSAGHACFSRAVDLARRLNNTYKEALTLTNLGWACERLRRFGEADSAYKEAARLADSMGHFRGRAHAHMSRANLALLRHDFDLARREALQSLEANRFAAMPFLESLAQENLALALGHLGLIDEALEAARKAANEGANLNNAARRDSARLAFSWIALLGGRYPLARSYAQLVRADTPDSELLLWRALIFLLLGALESSQPNGLPTLEDVDRLATTASPDHHLHTLEGLLHVGRKGVCGSWRVEDVEARLAAFLDEARR